MMDFRNALRQPYGVLLLSLIAARLAEQLLLYRAGFIALTADEFGRTVIAAKWAEHPYALFSGGWLPLHFYLIGLGLKLYWDLVLVPRLITIAIGLASIALEYQLGWLLTGSRPAALLGAFLLAMSPAHVWLSSTPLSELPFTICWLAALCGMIVKGSGSVGALYGAALALTGANGIRYEGWWISVIFCLALAIITVSRIRRGAISLRQALVILGAGALVGVFPLSWLAGNYIELGHPLAFAQIAHDYLIRWYPTTKDYEAYRQALIKLDPFALIGIPLGALVLGFRKRGSAVWCYLALTFGPLVIYLVLQNGQIEPEGNHLRYLALYLFTLYPLMAYALVALGTRLWQGKLAGAVLVCLLLLLIVGYQIRATFAFKNDPAADGLAVGQQIATLRQSNGKPQIAIVELTYWQFLAIHTGANDIDTIWYDRPVDLANRATQSYFLDRPNQIRSCLGEQNVGHLAARDSKIKQAIEHEFSIKASVPVGDFTVYTVDPSKIPDASRGSCPLDNRP